MTELANDRHHVIFIGAVNLDEIIRVKADIQPSASNLANWSHSLGGVATNACRAATAVNAATLNILLVAPIADDETGRRIREATVKLPIQSRLINLTNAISGRYTAVQDVAGDLVLGLANTEIAEQLTASALFPLIDKDNSTVVFDANLSAETIKAIASHSRKCNSIGLAVSPTKSTRLLGAARHIDLLFLNRLEVAKLTGESSENPLEIHAAELFNQGFNRFVITDGPSRLLVGCEGQVESILPAPLNTNTRGVNGLGDAFAGATIAGLLDTTNHQLGTVTDLLYCIHNYGLPACRQLAQSMKPDDV